MSGKIPVDRGITWSLPQLDHLRFMRATYVQHAFKPHAHAYFVIGMIEAGVQSFTYGRKQLITTPGRLIIINPGELHTGEAAIQDGFVYRALYPGLRLMEDLSHHFRQKSGTLPHFNGGIIQDAEMFKRIRKLHHISENSSDSMALESQLLAFMVELIERHSTNNSTLNSYQNAPVAVKLARDYLEAHYADLISLSDLAKITHMSAYHLARLFRRHTGIPPHKYLENVRIRHAERLLQSGMPIADVAFATGFSSQSHLSRTFKHFIGTTPGEFLR